MNQINTVNARLVYENTREIIIKANLDPDACKLTQSDLILEQQLLTTLTTYQFPVLANDNGPSGSRFNTEVRLQQQDSFIVSQLGIFLCKPTSATDTTYIPQSYPNPQVFTTANVASSAETIYNSMLRITVNNDVVLPVWAVNRHRMVPQTQQAPLIAGVQNAIPYSEIDMASDGFYPVEPNLVMIGSKGYIINVVLPAALVAVETFMRLRIQFRGILAQNSTIIT